MASTGQALMQAADAACFVYVCQCARLCFGGRDFGLAEQAGEVGGNGFAAGSAQVGGGLVLDEGLGIRQAA